MNPNDYSDIEIPCYGDVAETREPTPEQIAEAAAFEMAARAGDQDPA